MCGLKKMVYFLATKTLRTTYWIRCKVRKNYLYNNFPNILKISFTLLSHFDNIQLGGDCKKCCTLPEQLATVIKFTVQIQSLLLIFLAILAMNRVTTVQQQKEIKTVLTQFARICSNQFVVTKKSLGTPLSSQNKAIFNNCCSWRERIMVAYDSAFNFTLLKGKF